MLNPPDLKHVSDKAWSRARARLAAIEPLLAGSTSKQIVKQQAQATGIHVSTLYRWLQAYRATGKLTALLAEKPGVPAGHTRLAKDVEEIVSVCIEEIYLTRQRPSMQAVVTEIFARCRAANLNRPHQNTIRRRIAKIPDPVSTRRRKGSTAARAYVPIHGCFPMADAPLCAVQIDHTVVDIILVDDISRRSVGRPWITVAIDTFSRMIAGFYVSLDPPGAMSTGLCIAHAMLPKEIWLAKYGITTSWPVSGPIQMLHLDNAREFHGTMLQRACQNYGIELRWRPIKQPWYGGHIERWLGTFAQELKKLPGATFSNPVERRGYDSEKHAALTLTELEKWLSTFITEVYHQRGHSGIGVAPIRKYESRAIKDPVWKADERRLRLDFMPYLERTIQPYGIQIDGVAYYSDVLRRWVNSTEPNDRGHKRTFTIRRDPRDISVVYFWDPETEEYFPIPYRDTAHPAISVWELRQMRRKLREEGRNGFSEDLIFSALARMHEIANSAQRATKAARRGAQRRKHHSEIGLATSEASDSKTNDVATDLAEIKPFEIEEFDERIHSS
jgi:putative transposase